MPYRGAVDATIPGPFWGVYTRTSAPMFALPPTIPGTVIHFSAGGAPYIDDMLAREFASYPPKIRDRIGFDRLAGAVLRVEAGQAAVTRALTQLQALELQAALEASGALQNLSLEIQGNATADFNEYVHLGGFFRGRPFEVRYSGMVPYRIVGAAAKPWEDLLTTLHALAEA